MSLTNFLKNQLGITLSESALVEKEVKNFTSLLKESSKRRFREQDEELPVEEPEMEMEDSDISMDDISDMDTEDSDMDIDDSDISMDDISDMDTENGLVGGKYPDNEVEMIKIQLKSIVSNAESLMNTLDSEQNLDAWIQSKITLAQDYLNSAHDYIVYSDTYNSNDMEVDNDMDMDMDLDDMEVDNDMDMGEDSIEEPIAEEPKALPAPEETPEVKESFKYGFVSF